MSFLKAARFFTPFSIVLTVVSIVVMFYPGPRLSLEFTGGTLMEITLPEGKTKEDVKLAVQSFPGQPPLGNTVISTTQDRTAMLRLRNLSNEEHLGLLEYLNTELGSLTEKQFTTIGPTVGANLKRQSMWAIIIASIAIVLYIAVAFRGIPRRLSPWRFGIIAVITLLHDVAVTTAIMVLLSHVTTFEVDTLFITALLTVMGYSVNDTIVIFDRIRENLFLQEKREDFAAIAERSLRETLTRSLNTGASTLIMLIALFFFGTESIRWFVLTLIIGTAFGAYSSIFLAAPLLVFWQERKGAR